MTGRPRRYKRADAEEILGRLAKGESLLSICKDESLPSRTAVHKWVIEDTDGFASRYAHAREIGDEVMFDDLVRIADDASRDVIQTEHGERPNNELVQRSRLRVDTRKWWLARRNPGKYGDRVEVAGSLDVNVRSDEQLNRSLALLLGKMGVAVIGGAGADAGAEPEPEGGEGGSGG